jgi:hypothetical protein
MRWSAFIDRYLSVIAAHGLTPFDEDSFILSVA